jgi:hypothetical protein
VTHYAQSLIYVRRALVGVVWGEGEGPVNQRGRAAGADISAWIGRLIRVVWRRFFT